MLKASESKDVLEKISNQADRLNMKSQDVAALADIIHVTYINNFKKVKTPKFNDIYRISLAIGMPIDALLYDDANAHEKDPRNILYWYKKEESEIHPSSLLCALPDKVALADFLNSLKETADTTSFELIRKMLLLQDADFIFLYNIISSRMPYYKEGEPLFVVRDNLYDIWKSMRGIYESVWEQKTAITHMFWKTVDSKIPEVFDTRTKFIRASGVSTKAYNEYLDENGTSSPTTETMVKVASLLDIESIDDAIRANVPEIFDVSSIKKSTEDNSCTPYEITLPGLRQHLKTMPKLGMFIDQLLALSELDLKYLINLVDDMLQHPFSSYCYTDPKLREI